MSKAQEALQPLPPSYEEAMRGSEMYGSSKAPSAPCLPSPEHETFNQPPLVPMPPGIGGFAEVRGGPSQPLPPAIAPLPMPAPSGVPPQGVPMYMVPPTTTSTVYVSPPLVGPKPCTLTCPACHQKVRTTTTVTNAGKAHAICIIMCLLGCCCCSCLPYCFSSCKITKHECPNCKSYLGSYKP